MEGDRKMDAVDGTPMGYGFLAYPKDSILGVRVSTGNLGEELNATGRG